MAINKIIDKAVTEAAEAVAKGAGNSIDDVVKKGANRFKNTSSKFKRFKSTAANSVDDIEAAAMSAEKQGTRQNLIDSYRNVPESTGVPFDGDKLAASGGINSKTIGDMQSEFKAQQDSIKFENGDNIQQQRAQGLNNRAEKMGFEPANVVGRDGFKNGEGNFIERGEFKDMSSYKNRRTGNVNDAIKSGDTSGLTSSEMGDFNNMPAYSKNKISGKQTGTTMDETIKKKSGKQSYDDYVESKYNTQADNAWEKYQGASDERKAGMDKLYGVEEGGSAEDSIRNSFKKKIDDGGTLGDKAGYYKVPQKVAGVGATAWLVSSMSGQKGEQSNDQLYGQQPAYGGM